MKRTLALVAILAIFSLTANAGEEKESWSAAGVKPDPYITIPFIGIKTPLPAVCAGKGISASFDFKCTKESFMLKLPYFKMDWDFPALSLGRGKAKVTLGTE